MRDLIGLWSTLERAQRCVDPGYGARVSFHIWVEYQMQSLASDVKHEIRLCRVVVREESRPMQRGGGQLSAETRTITYA